ncbi:MAG TPA: tyrosine-type recombinase/integrase, partial [Roseiflexaceae bacterium]
LWGNVAYDDQELHITGALKRRLSDAPRPGARYVLIREPFTKTRDERTTRLSPDVADALRAQWKRQQQQRRDAGGAWEERGLIFTNTYGRPLDLTTTANRFKKLAEKAGLPPAFTFHNLRHSAATFLIKQGEQPRTIMEILGHRNLRTTERYGTVLPEVTRDALDKHGQRLRRRGGEK